MELEYTPKFKKELKRLSKKLQVQVIEKLKKFVEDPFYPSFRTKPMQGQKGDNKIWEAHITREVVFTFHWDEGLPLNERTIYLRRIGSHAIYKKP